MSTALCSAAIKLLCDSHGTAVATTRMRLQEHHTLFPKAGYSDKQLFKDTRFKVLWASLASRCVAAVLIHAWCVAPVHSLDLLCEKLAWHTLRTPNKC